MIEVREVFIPRSPNHEGLFGVCIKLKWNCPVCGGPRGPIFRTQSFDGSRRLDCDGWINPCGHVDKYEDVIKECLGDPENVTIKKGSD